MSHRRPLTAEQLAPVLARLSGRHAARLLEGEQLAVDHAPDDDTDALGVNVVRGPEVFRFQACVHREDVASGETLELLVAFLDAVLDEWISGEREAYPTLDYSPYEFRGVTVGLRGGPMRPDLEAAADEFLARHGARTSDDFDVH